MDVSIVIPVNNEAGNIGRLLDETAIVCESLVASRSPLVPEFDYEIVVVDDGSSDATPQILKQAIAEFPALRVISHQQCCGQSTALTTGIRAARGEIVVTLDGDGQNDPGDIRSLVAALENSPADVRLIAGHRQNRRDTAWRRFVSRIANRVRQALLGDATPDSGCGAKAFYRETFLLLPYFDHMHRFLPALVLRAGGGVQSVAVSHRPRVAGRSHYGTLGRMMAGIADVMGVMWLKHRSFQPMFSELGQPMLLPFRTQTESAAAEPDQNTRTEAVG